MRVRNETVRAEGLVTGYSSRHGNVTVTAGVSASLFSGELTCLLGPNGAGKSTLMKTLSGFLPPLSGMVAVEGRRIADYSAPELARVIGVVLTERVTLANMSVYELVAMGRSPYTGFWGRMDAHDREVVEESLDLVRVGELRDRMVSTLSDGERQKVMIAKALAQETPVIFLDEPTAFLDYPSKVEIMQLLQSLSRVKQKTVFLSTHDLEIALQIADMAWLIDREHGVATGAPEDLSASGLLGLYFEREGIEFDMEAGLFRIRHHITRSIRLDGEGPRVGLVAKALARNGIQAGRDVASDETVAVTDDGYLYQGRLRPSIEALLGALL
ncbi:MAG: ABC transporter ATP-binding protein [Pseudoflavonifractor sp.]|nr:ABC transporter ATP-binding protein [Alloprevotella sp.]MCM1116657.1 ABC transporter ATP-binding protein [Pseudoflavonifractor sp.]